METKNPVFFLKFGRKKDLESLCQGNIYVNNGEFFSNYTEKEEVNECIGDQYELKLPFEGSQVVIKSNGHNLIEGKSKMVFQYNDDSKKAMFCVYSLYEEDFAFDEKEQGFKLQLSDEKKEYIVKNFNNEDRDSVIIFPSKLFIEAVEFECAKRNIPVIHSSIQFYDHKAPYVEQINDFSSKSEKRFFWKRTDYINQCEYRFIFGEDIEAGKVIINIKDLLKNAKPLSINEFVNDCEVIAKI